MAEAITSTSPDVRAKAQVVTESASGAIGIKDGTVYLQGSGALAMTLALPTAGLDDGKELEVVDTTGQAHTVTTPSNGINGNKHVATMAGTAYQSVKFKAFNGAWVVNPSVTGYSLS